MNFEFLLVLNHDDVIWDCLKKEDLGKRGIIKHTILRKVGGAIGTLYQKNLRFCFNIPQILIVALIFSTKHGILL